MKRLILAGFGQPILDLIANFESEFTVVGVVLDYERRKSFSDFYEKLEIKKIPIIAIENVNFIQYDGLVVINYNKIIDIKAIECPFVLNIHMGLLPLYRGNSANSWSILNGDRSVGYTLHQVSDILDGGAIYYKFLYEIQETETYFHAKIAINYDLRISLPKIIGKILNQEIRGENQENEEFIYASKLIPEDGILSHWNYTTEEIISRNMIFSKPLGTGLKIKYKNQLVEITKLSKILKYKISNGFPGAVVLKTREGSVWIKTKDTAISIDEISINDLLVKPNAIFKIGDRL